MKGRTDQVPFRTPLYKEKELSFYTLTPGYHFRSLFPPFASNKVKIIHHRNFIMFIQQKKPHLLTKISSTTKLRLYNYTNFSTKSKSSLEFNRIVRMLYELPR